ncbi:MAG: hypothetical protein AB7G24_00925 [Novosphingobium sp.]
MTLPPAKVGTAPPGQDKRRAPGRGVTGTIPAEQHIRAIIRETGMGRMQAINHLRQRAALQNMTQPNRRKGIA